MKWDSERWVEIEMIDFLSELLKESYWGDIEEDSEDYWADVEEEEENEWADAVEEQ